MALATLADILPAARREGRAVAAFNVANLETVLGVVRAAERERAPLIVQVYERLFGDERAGLIAAMTRRLAERARVPIVLHLDHGVSLEQVEQALELGYTSVMIDGSRLPFAENVELTARAAALARRAGASLEAEIGHVPFGGGPPALSTADEAAAFAQASGVDALAVSIGSAHGFYKKEPVLDIARCREIGRRVAVPLVLHGGTGIPEDQVRQAIACGVAKINIATEYQDLFAKSVADVLREAGGKFLPVDKLFKPVEARLEAFARGKIRVFAGPPAGS